MNKLIDILLIEDNPPDARLVMEYLNTCKDARFNLTTAGTLQNGISIIKDSAPDIILLDMNLPDCSGMRTFDKIYSENRDLPVILLTGTDDEVLAAEAIKKGAQDYLVKSQINDILLSRSVLHSIERKKTGDKIIKLNRIYAVLSEINKAIVRIEDQQELFDTACKIAVETGGFRFCWIGIIDKVNDRVMPVARYGYSSNFLEKISISLSADKPEGKDPAGTAAREKKFNICNDIENDKRELPWRKEILEQGFLSSSVFPLTRSDRIYGVIIFYSSQTGFFDEEEIKLLDELSSDISYCIETIERQKEKQKIKEERDRLFNYSIDMMGIGGFDGYYKQLNPAWEKTLGWTNEELTAKPYVDFIHPEDLESALKIIGELKAGAAVKENFICRYLCKDRSYKWLSWNSVTIKNENLIFIVTRDVSEIIRNENERKTLEEQLIQAQKLESLGTMAGGVAHDFNNILNIIIGYISVLKSIEKIEDRDDYLDNLNVIFDASKRGADLVKQLLTFARKSESVSQAVQVKDIIAEIIKLLKETFPKTIEINCEIKGELPLIIADSTQIHQVLLNLCVNSRDAMEKGGALTISAKRINGNSIQFNAVNVVDKAYIEIDVSDTGSGISEETKQKIFEPFFTTKDIGKGTGLGLALVYSIIKNHGGEIDIISAPEKGATFKIYLPVQDNAIQDQQVEPGKEEDIS